MKNRIMSNTSYITRNVEMTHPYKGELKYLTLPRYPLEESAPVLFKKAFAIDLDLDNSKSDHTNMTRLYEMIRAYEDVFDAGVPEAGINLLRYLFITQFEVKCNDAERLPVLNDRYMRIVEELEQYKHPAGRYYRALGLFMGIVTNNLEENIEDIGLSELIDLADEGNPYAVETAKGFHLWI